MNRPTLTLLLVLPLLTTACVSRQSEIARKLGYEKSSKVQAGPYELHHGRSGSDELMLLAEGNWNILSRDAQGTAVYLDGRPFIQFDLNPDGSLTNLSMQVMDAHGTTKATLIDTNADGEWDLKLDRASGKGFVRKDGQWMQR